MILYSKTVQIATKLIVLDILKQLETNSWSRTNVLQIKQYWIDHKV